MLIKIFQRLYYFISILGGKMLFKDFQLRLSIAMYGDNNWISRTAFHTRSKIIGILIELLHFHQTSQHANSFRTHNKWLTPVIYDVGVTSHTRSKQWKIVHECSLKIWNHVKKSQKTIRKFDFKCFINVSINSSLKLYFGLGTIFGCFSLCA